MHYKTIILGLLEEHPKLHEQLRGEGKLFQAMELHAVVLKASHEAWKEKLRQTRPEGEESQIASEALEIAIKEMENSFPFRSPTPDGETFCLEEAMAFIKHRTPPR